MKEQHIVVLATMDGTAIGQALKEHEEAAIAKERREIEERPVLHLGPDVDPREHVLFRLGRISGLSERNTLIKQAQKEYAK